MKRFLKVLFTLLVLSGLVAAGGAWYMLRSSAPRSVLITTQVKKGDLLATINASGVLQPEEVIDVGAQIAGQIMKFGVDKDGKKIDYGSAVEENTVLAEIDDSLYQADAAQAAAQLDQAKASVTKAEADLGQMKAKLEQARRDWERAQKLGPSDALAESNYDAYKAAYEQAKANVGVGEATILQAKGSVAQAEATVKRAQRNLGYCVIKSPVKGVIIDRRVNIGQTVVASLNAPSLFLLAKDLSHMQIWVAVNEADINSIHPGQNVTFTVESSDTGPKPVYNGTVGKIRLNATMTQNVVTYTVEVNIDNSARKLLPYQTANVNFEVSRRDGVLMIPNAALRWSPSSAQQVAPDFREAYANGEIRGRGGRGMGGGAMGGGAMAAGPMGGASPAMGGQGMGGARMGGGRPGGAGGAGPAAGGAARQRPDRAGPAAGQQGGPRGTLWVRDGEFVKPVDVRVGLSDGINTEVQSKDLAEGTEVVINEQVPDAGRPSGLTNPFTPQFPSRGGRR